MIICSCNLNSNKTYLLSITPPFDNLKVKTLDFEINNINDTLLNLNNGTSIYIPKDAFQTKDGQSVMNNVKIHFTEFNDPSKIIACGIPMTYIDEQGRQQQMESAGMFEIRGFSDNQELVIKENKDIEVNLATSINGDFDFFYFQEDESGSKGSWKILAKNTLNDSIHIAKGKSLAFDTTSNQETKILSKISWNIRSVETKDSIDWIYKQKWNTIDISKPELIPELVSRFKNDLYSDGPQNYLSPDSTIIYSIYKNVIYIRNWQGNVIKKLKNKKYDGGYFVNNSIFLAYYNKGDYDFYNKKWELIASINEAYNFYTLKNRKLHVYTNISKSNNTHFFIDIIDNSGQLVATIKCKKHPRMSYNYGWDWDDKKGKGLTEFVLNRNQNLIAINTGDGIFIYDLAGKQIKKLTYPVTFSGIEFLDFSDALLIEEWSGELKVWNWRNDKFIKMPDEINADKFINHSDHPNKPIIIISNRGANYFLIWNWEKNKYTKHVTSRELGQLYFTYEYIDNYNYIGEYSYNRGFKILWNNKGDEIIRIEEFPGKYASIRIVKANNRIISKNGKEFCIYKSNGELIKRFKLDETKYSETDDYFDKFLLYNQNGFVSFLDSNGIYLRSIKLDQESSIWGNYNYLDSLIFVNTAFNSHKEYNSKGELKANFGRYYKTSSVDSCYLLESYHDKELFIVRKSHTSLDINEYQIILQNKDYQFTGIVQLDFETKKIIEQYQELYLKKYRIKKQKEKNRVEQESRLVRSFQIKNFGIYNWDRMYKRSNAILCRAKLVLNKSSEIESYNSFLITGENKNTVIKYSGNEIEKFAFDPITFNQLLMILPDNTIAVFANKDFKNISTNNLNEESELVLKLTEYSKVESMDFLKKIITE